MAATPDDVTSRRVLGDVDVPVSKQSATALRSESQFTSHTFSMATVDELPPSVTSFDYIIVGGGTAGCVIACRLAEALPDKSVLVIEGGPSDYGNESVLNLRGASDLWGADMDYKYVSVPQEFGKLSYPAQQWQRLGC